MDGRLKTVKICCIGDYGVGKSTLVRRVHRMLPDALCKHALYTTDCIRKCFEIDGNQVIAEFWDTVGQEKFKYLGRVFLYGCACFILMFDVSEKTSFDNLKFWIKFVQEACEGNLPPIILVANKIDISTDKMWEDLYLEFAWAKIRLLLLAAKDKKSLLSQTFPSELLGYLAILSIPVIGLFPKEGETMLPWLLDDPVPSFKLSVLRGNLNNILTKAVSAGLVFEQREQDKLMLTSPPPEENWSSCPC